MKDFIIKSIVVVVLVMGSAMTFYFLFSPYERCVKRRLEDTIYNENPFVAQRYENSSHYSLTRQCSELTW